MNWQTLIRQLIHPRACRRPIAGLLAGLALLCTAGAARADSWLFRPSTYSHDPLTGRRVNQYRPEEPAYVWLDPTYMRSGYRHIRMSFRGPGGSFDHTHIVQTWGAGEWIRPYGEWQFPFRAGATPYGPWGNPQGPWTLPYESWYNPYGLWNPYRWAYPVPYAPRGRRPGGAGPHHPGPTPYGPAPHSPFGRASQSLWFWRAWSRRRRLGRAWQRWGTWPREWWSRWSRDSWFRWLRGFWFRRLGVRALERV